MPADPNIIVVDDHPEIRESVAKYLRRNGMSVETAENASTLDDALAQSSFDLIVLDVMMPGENGIEACRRLRKTKDTPILMLTAKDADASIVEGFGAGADGLSSTRGYVSGYIESEVEFRVVDGFFVDFVDTQIEGIVDGWILGMKGILDAGEDEYDFMEEGREEDSREECINRERVVEYVKEGIAEGGGLQHVKPL